MTEPKLYPDVRPWEVEPYYSQHVGAMTREGLHGKAEIAEQLAWRDSRLAFLEVVAEAALAQVDDARKLRENLRADLLATRRALKLAQARGLWQFHWVLYHASPAEEHQTPLCFRRRNKFRAMRLVTHWREKFEREAGEL